MKSAHKRCPDRFLGIYDFGNEFNAIYANKGEECASVTRYRKKKDDNFVLYGSNVTVIDFNKLITITA